MSNFNRCALVYSAIHRRGYLYQDMLKGGPVKLERKNVISINEENKDSNLSNGYSSSSVVEQVDDPCSTSPICAAPLCRQFWKAGNYDDVFCSKSTPQSGTNYLHVHPKFLHSNATSHKWVFGAIAELLDNAVDESQNGATYVLVNKVNNPRDGCPALLIQDNGAGMNPGAIRRFMSFGFSDKNSNLAIGQYGNGFKTSSMRLGADVIVFSRHMINGTLTQSIGLLSYTFLTQQCYDRIVVPLVDYEFSASTKQLEPILLNGRKHFNSNLSLLLRWSPYSSEIDLQNQFMDIGTSGTKIVIYNLWLTDDGITELNFDSDLEDICVATETGRFKPTATDKHMANRLHYSLRTYLSILYLHMPERFRIVLRGLDVQYHNIADELKYPEFILYKPHNGGSLEGDVVTTIGFLKEAPHVNVHGFCLYNKNRLIMPFWKVFQSNRGYGRGVAGVLQANFIEPSHNKQDFERTSLFQKLETRLREMTREYWNFHCHLIGYSGSKGEMTHKPVEGQPPSKHDRGIQKPVTLNKVLPTSGFMDPKLVPSCGHSKASSSQCAGVQSSTLLRSCSQEDVQKKRVKCDEFLEQQMVKRKAVTGFGILDSRNWEIEPLDKATTQVNDEELLIMMQKNKDLRAQFMENEKELEEYNAKVGKLQLELDQLRLKQDSLKSELLESATVKKQVIGKADFFRF